MIMNGIQCFTEVRYFARFIQNPGQAVDNRDPPAENGLLQFTNVTLVTLYSLPNPILIQQSLGTFALCTS